MLIADKDFGELIFRQERIKKGVILIRQAGISRVRKAEIVASALAAHRREMEGAFTVISPGAVRIRCRAAKSQKDDIAQHPLQPTRLRWRSGGRLSLGAMP